MGILQAQAGEACFAEGFRSKKKTSELLEANEFPPEPGEAFAGWDISATGLQGHLLSVQACGSGQHFCRPGPASTG